MVTPLTDYGYIVDFSGYMNSCMDKNSIRPKFSVR